ncbi:putative RING-H2 finger protein ATL21A [Papaver somniferum]|uniref:putative RING-H2 finger protein ATL21A n=1 Tax=Papaver somniferum TaxID=3469 RepID=UPI000E6FC03F|nr:putative RING-H2 finger protein ATL21A [Papaver somniferum]
MNKTILELPFSGKFFVRNLYNFPQKIEIYDPDNCLEKRILKLNLSGTAYHLGEHGVSYQKYSFLNCSSSIDSLLKITTKLTHIRCLSSSTHTVITADVPTANNFSVNTSCLHIADVPIPYSPIQKGVPVDLNENFVLSYLTCKKKSDRMKVLIITLVSIFYGLPCLSILIVWCYLWLRSGSQRSNVRASMRCFFTCNDTFGE